MDEFWTEDAGWGDRWMVGRRGEVEITRRFDRPMIELGMVTPEVLLETARKMTERADMLARPYGG